MHTFCVLILLCLCLTGNIEKLEAPQDKNFGHKMPLPGPNNVIALFKSSKDIQIYVFILNFLRLTLSLSRDTFLNIFYGRQLLPQFLR